MGDEEDELYGNVKHYSVRFRPRIGSGAFGTVYRATNRNTRDAVAGKEIIYSDDWEQHQDVLRMAEQEIGVISKLQNHKNIDKIFEHFTRPKALWIIMEYCDLGDLNHYLDKNENLSRFGQVRIMQQAASAVAYMHSQNPPIIHRDLKLQNILMKSEGEEEVLKVCDFGFAKFYEDKAHTSYSAAFAQRPFLSSLKGTAPFMAPEFSAELEEGLKYDASVDIFALGLVFLVVLEPNRPDFYPLSEEKRKSKQFVNIGYEMVDCFKRGHPLPVVISTKPTDDRLTKSLKRIITHMTKFKATQRRDISDVNDELTEILECMTGEKLQQQQEPELESTSDLVWSLDVISEDDWALASISDQQERHEN